jgi:rare lipoprotein A
VRVNDRGPFIKGRVVDVSHSAAEQLGLTQQGVAKVKIDVVQ